VSDCRELDTANKIASVTTWILDIPLIRPHKFSVATMDTQGVLLIRVTTGGGVVGWGEGVVPGGPWWGGESIEGMAAIVDRHLAPLVIGQDVTRPEAVARRLEKLVGGAPFARSGVEMAFQYTSYWGGLSATDSQ
jgi:muconate cycloisomerase